MALGPLRPQPSRFYDGGNDDEPPDPAGELRLVLERVSEGEADRFVMLRRIAYRDEVYRDLLVPADLRSFWTDLASVPALFTWLVPRTGTHLAAAVLHDGLVHGDGRPTYIALDPPPDAPPIDRVVADEIFRRAMHDSGTGPVRAWLVWSAVTLGTVWRGSTAWSRAEHLRYLVAAGASLLTIAVLGVLATLDLFDVVDLIPWMGAGRSFAVELAGGLAGAVVIPLLLGLTWGRFAVAGVITGIALAVLLHVSAVLATITLLYQLAERVARRTPAAGLGATGVVVLACAVFTALLVGTSG